jgi:hypothetical protein
VILVVRDESERDRERERQRERITPSINAAVGNYHCIIASLRTWLIQ